MPLISAFTVVRAIAISHLTAAYFFLTAPRAVADQNAIFMLGESIRLPHVASLDKPNEASAFIAVLLAFLGLSDLVAASLEEEISMLFFTSCVPARLLFLFGLTGYIYLFKDDGLLGKVSVRQAGVGENLRNSMTFAWGFVEIAAWFWVFTSLREERRELVKKRMNERKREQDHL